tara:strand:- start:2199 stop:2339 length:141 start_codon:yes stop_codon:yes gene_type:complete
MIANSTISDNDDEFKVTDEQSFSNSENNLLAIEREKRNSKFQKTNH